MRALVAFLAAVGLCCWVSSADAGRHGIAVAAKCDVTTGVATGTGAGTCAANPATCNGVADDALAFAQWNNWAVGTWQASNSGLVELYVPPGRKCMFLSHQTVGVGDSKFPLAGLKNVIAVGYESTWSDNNVGANGFGLGQPTNIKSGDGNFGTTNIWTTLLNTVSAGSRIIRCSDGACNDQHSGASLGLSVGDWVLIAGFDLQSGGTPPNNHFFDWNKIAAISSGNVTLAWPLKYSYESTWPHINFGSAGLNPDQAGPATLYVINSNWNADIDVRGLTLDQPDAQWYAKARSVILRDLKITGTHCLVPTVQVVFSVINSDYSTCTGAPGNGLEIDKFITALNFSGGTFRHIEFQSSSVDVFNLTGAHVTGNVVGTPKQTNITNSTIDGTLSMGADAFGRSDSIVCSNSSIAAIAAKAYNASVSGLSMSGGVITVPSGIIPWAVPRTNLQWQGSNVYDTGFYVVDVTKDANGLEIQTNLSGGFPTVPGGLGNIGVHPMPSITSSGCSGVGGTQLNVQSGGPLFAKAQWTRTGADGTVSISAPTIWGAMVSIDYNVTNAYNSALSYNVATFFNTPIDFGSYPTITAGTYGASINMQTAGNRHVTPPNNVSPVVMGDSGLSAGSPFWFPRSTGGGSFSADASAACLPSPGPNCPSITITIQTNQGLVSP